MRLVSLARPITERFERRTVIRHDSDYHHQLARLGGRQADSVTASPPPGVAVFPLAIINIAAALLPGIATATQIRGARQGARILPKQRQGRSPCAYDPWPLPHRCFGQSVSRSKHWRLRTPGRPGLVLDVRLPGHSGFDFRRQLRPLTFISLSSSSRGRLHSDASPGNARWSDRIPEVLSGPRLARCGPARPGSRPRTS